MRHDCAIAHGVWNLAAYPSDRAFALACAATSSAQERLLLQIIRRNERTELGSKHRFGTIDSVSKFRDAVPLSTYEDYVSSIRRIRDGAKAVLTAGPVERLHLTSGTVSGSKQIPFGAALRDDFSRAIDPWCRSLYREYPDIKRGTSYWVITPPSELRTDSGSAVPIGFDDDDEYLSFSARAVQRVLRSGPALQSAPGRYDSFSFRYRAAFYLLQDRALSLISLWSPTYLLSLLDIIAAHAGELVDDIAFGAPRAAGYALHNLRSPRPARSAELAPLLRAGTISWQDVWPNLALISGWSDGWAIEPAQKLQHLFPRVPYQGKGLLSTEAVVSIPYTAPPGTNLQSRGSLAPVLAVTSHFFELIRTSDDAIFLVHELREGEEYEVAVTTSGGLYRYRTGDLVRCEGFLGNAPRLRFLCRRGNVSDLCGEKLDERFVGHALEAALSSCGIVGAPAFLSPGAETEPLRYYAFVAGADRVSEIDRLQRRIDEELKRNVHYGAARKLGQLGPVGVRLLTVAQLDRYLRSRAVSARESTVKLLPLDRNRGLEKVL